MSKPIALIAALLLCAVLVLSPASGGPVSADTENGTLDGLVVSVAGNGTWEDDTWLVSMYPGQSRELTFTLENVLDVPLELTMYVSPCSMDNGNIKLCFCSRNFTIPVGGNSTTTLVATASGSTSPGTYLVAVWIEGAEGAVEPDPEDPEPDPDSDPDPDPDPDLEPGPGPVSVILTSSSPSQPVGSEIPVLAVVRDASSIPVANVPVMWSVLTGSAAFVSSEASTDSDGLAHAVLISQIPSQSQVRCAVSGASPSVRGNLTLSWETPSANGGDDDDAVTPPGGTSGWLVLFLVFVVGLVTFILYRLVRSRRRAREDEQALWPGDGELPPDATE